MKISIPARWTTLLMATEGALFLVCILFSYELSGEAFYTLYIGFLVLILAGGITGPLMLMLGILQKKPMIRRSAIALIVLNTIPMGIGMIAGITTSTTVTYEPAPPAQELEPVANMYTYHSPEYLAKMQEVLFNRAESKNVFQFLCKPSFSPEILLTLRIEGDDYVAQVLLPQTSIYSHKDDISNVKVLEKEKKLPKRLADQASHLWQTMLLRTRVQQRLRYYDGVSYMFSGSAPGHYRLSAKSSNPEFGTKPAILASIGELLITYVQAEPDEEKEIENKIQEHMETLENALRTKNSKVEWKSRTRN